MSNAVTHRRGSFPPSSQPVEGVQLRTPPWGLKWRSHTLFILITVAIGVFTDLFLYSLIVPVLPFMLRDRVHVPEDQIQSRIDNMLAMYAGGSVVFSPLSGVIADQLSSRQLPFLTGLFALFAATLLLDIGTTLPVLYFARFLQGVSAAIVWTVGMALTLETVGAGNLGKTFGTMFTFISSGTVLAPALGGALYKHVGYNGVFGVGGAVLLVDFLMRLILIEKRVAAQYEVDADDAAVDDSNSVHEYDAARPQPQPHSAGDGDGDADADAEADERAPLLKATNQPSGYEIPEGQPKWVQALPFVYCLRDVSLLTSYLICFIQALIIAAFDATLPKYSEETFGFDSLQAGLMFTPLGALDLLTGPLAGWAIDRFGPRPIATIGYVMIAPVLACLRFVTENTTSQLVLYAILLGLSGIGLSLIGGPSMVEGGLVVQRYYEANPAFFKHRTPNAQLYGLNSMVFMAGLTVGPPIAGTLKDTIGYGNMNAVQAIIAGVAALISWTFLGRRPTPRGQTQGATST